MTQIIREKKNKRLMLKLYQAKFRKSYQYCFLSKQIIVRLIFFARKWKYTNTALPLTLEGWGGGWERGCISKPESSKFKIFAQHSRSS